MNEETTSALTTQDQSTGPKIRPVAEASAMAILASRLQCEPGKLLKTLQETVFKNSSESELIALVIVSNEYGLNPLLKEIYAFPAKGGGIVPVVSIDGWIKIMNSHPQYDGIDFEWEHDNSGKLVACTSLIFRRDRSRPVRVTEYLEECRRNTDPWKMEHRMLRHKALIQGARVAFGFSGIVDEDEGELMKRAEGRDVTSGGPNLEKGETSKKAAPALKDKTPDNPVDREQQSTAESDPTPAADDIAATPQDRLLIAAETSDITESALMKHLRKLRITEAQKVNQMEAADAERALSAWSEILAALNA